MLSPNMWLTVSVFAFAVISSSSHQLRNWLSPEHNLALIPMPRAVAVKPQCEFHFGHAAPLRIPRNADPAGREILADRFSRLGVQSSDNNARAFLTIRRMHGQPESYTLDVDRSRIAIVAADGAGEMDAFATLAQLVQPTAIPCVHISDRPAMRWRFVSDDISRGPLPTMAYFAKRIKRLATYKINGYSIYLENVVRRPGHEDETRADALTKGELAQLARLALRYHMQFVPEQESFGHLGALLANARYADVRENPTTDLISPAVPRSYRVLRDLFSSEFAGLPNVRFIHIGGDEPFELGTGRSVAMVRANGYGFVYARHMLRVAKIAQDLGARPILWGDELLQHPDAMQYLPRSIIVAPYWYHVEPSYANYIVPLRKAGFDVVVAPSVANFSQFFPDLTSATKNIAGFVDDGKALHARGMLLTIWIGLRDELYDATWYPVAFAAAHAWEQKGPSNDQFCPRYAALMFSNEDACGAFGDLAALGDWFAGAFPYDTPDTLLRADRRVPFLDAQIRIHTNDYPRMTQLVADLQARTASLNGSQDVHERNAVRLAALRYGLLMQWLTGSGLSESKIEGAERLHLAEWRYENRPLTATDQVTQAYRILEPIPKVQTVAFRLPATPVTHPAEEVRRIFAWLRAQDPTTADPSFLFEDTLRYIVRGRGIEPSQAAPFLARSDALLTSSTDPVAHAAGRYLFAVIRKAEMPVEIRHDYQTLLSVGPRTNPATFTTPAYRILADLGNHEADLSAVQEAVRVLPRSGSAVQALDAQQQRTRSMENCFNTFVHEWELVRRTGGGIDDERARLAPTVQAAFCSA